MDGTLPFQAYNLSTTHPLRFLETSETTDQQQQVTQVIVPQMRFRCVGSITGWLAHTLILTKPGFVDILTHTITFQVWRPGTNNSYMLVGSNKLLFPSGVLRDGITRIRGRTDIAYFSFNETVPENEQIVFVPGDVIGWFIPKFGVNNFPPLSVLYTDSSPLGGQEEELVTMYALVRETEPCAVCDIEEAAENSPGGASDAGIYKSVRPFVSAVYGK